MRLATVKAFRDLIYAPGSAPTPSTIRARIERGDIPGGRKDGRNYYVDLDEYDAVTRLGEKLETRRRELAVRPELEGLL